MFVKCRRLLFASMVAATVALSGCEQSTTQATAPSPIEVTADATGHYCGMLLAEHEGPKGQIHLASRSEPVWFSSVRDTVSFLRLPEEARDITAIYVNDMGKASRWESPEAGAWVDARKAWFVIESDRRGGMGAPEAVPFSQQDAAEAFRTAHGGRVVQLAGIPDDYVLGPVETAADGEAQHGQHAGAPAAAPGAAGHGSHGSH